MFLTISLSLLCETVLPSTPEGSLVSRTKVILQEAFSKSLIRNGKVFSMNSASDLAVKINARIEFPNCFKEVLPEQREYSNTKGSVYLSSEGFVHKRRRAYILVGEGNQ